MEESSELGRPVDSANDHHAACTSPSEPVAEVVSLGSGHPVDSANDHHVACMCPLVQQSSMMIL